MMDGALQSYTRQGAVENLHKLFHRNAARGLPGYFLGEQGNRVK